MSAKAKTKAESNHKIEIVDASSAPADGTTPSPVPDGTAPAAIPDGTPPSEAVAVKPPLAARLKLAGNQAILASFARFRTAQATAISKTLAWVAILDTALTRSLTVSEQFLLTRLSAAPAPAPAPAAE